MGGRPTAKTVTLTGATLSGADAGNYNLTSVATATASITAKSVDGTFTASSKVYDGNTAATISSRSLTGQLGGDTVNLSGGTATFADKNVGTAKVVNGTGFSLTGADAGNYTLGSSSLTASADITAKAVTITADAQTKVYGTLDPALTYQVTSGGLVGGDAFSGSLSRAAGENVATGPYAILQGTVAAGPNYDLTYVGANLTITKASQTITFDPAGPTKFGETLPLSATSSSLLEVLFELMSGPATLSGNTLTPNANGNATTSVVVKAKQVGDGNYNGALDVLQTIWIKENAAPTSTASQSPAADWTNQSVTVTLHATDVGDGVATISYRIGTSGSFTTGTPDVNGDLVIPAFTSEGTYTVEYYATDVNGNVEATHHTHTVKIDKTAPTGSVTAPAFDRVDSLGRPWYRSQRVDIVFNGTDSGGSGLIAPTSVQLNTVQNSQSGYATLSHSFSDNAGNSGPVLFEYWYDDVKPVISLSETPADFVQSLLALTVTVSEAFLLDKQIRLYRKATIGATEVEVTTWNNGDPIQTDGIYRLTVYAVDQAGNEAAPFEKTFTVLNSAPTLEITSPAAGWHQTAQTVDYYGQNAVGQVLNWIARELLGLSTAPMTPLLSGTVVNPEGRYTVNVSGKDELDRIASKSREFQIDGTPPVVDTPVLSGTHGNGAWFKGTKVSVSISANDPELRATVPGAGVQEVRYYTTGADERGSAGTPIVVPGNTASFDISANGTTTIHYWAVDVAGNASGEATATVLFDNVAPVITGTPSNTTLDATSRDGATVLPHSGASATDNIGPATITFSPSSLDFSVGSHTVTMTATDPAGNSTLTTFNVTVNRPLPTLTGIAPANAIYGDADATVTLTGTGIFADTKVKIGSELYSASSSTWTSLTFTLPIGNAGTKLVKVSTPARSAGAGDGGESAASANFVVAPKPISVTADVQSKVYGNSDPALTYAVSGSLVGSDAFSGALSRVAGENVGPYAINQGSLALSSNYALTFTGNNLTITTRPITIKADDQAKTYGNADPALTYSITSGSLAFADAVSGSLSRVSGENVGSYAINQGTVGVSSNYAVTFTAGSLVIGKREVSVQADFKTKVYGSADPELTQQFLPGSSLAFSDTFTGGLTRAAGESVGLYAISKGTLALSNNYTLYFTGNNLEITPRSVTVTADAQTKVYGESDPALTYSVPPGSLVSGDSFTGALTRDPGQNVGLYNINQGSLVLNSNYVLSYVGAKLKITAKSVTITANNKSKTYGEANPTLDAAVDGAVGSETLLYSLSTTATSSSDVNIGGYPITVTVGSNPNYEVTVVPGTLTINKASATVNVSGYTGVYDGTAHGATGTASGVGGANLNGSLSLGASFRNVPGGTASWTFSGGTNYHDQNGTAAIVITARPLTVSATGVAKEYDGSTAATVTLTDNRVDFDVLATSYAAATFADKNVGTGKTVSVTGISISGADAGNYTFNTEASATADITTRSVTVTADTKSKTYGDADPALTYQITTGTLATGDGFTGSLTRAAGENVGPYYAIQQGTLALDANYTLTYVGANLTITKATLSITVNNKSMKYHGAVPALDGTLTGVVSGDNITATYNTVATSSTMPGAYDITVTLNDPNDKLGNYLVPSPMPKGTLTITFNGNSGILQPINADESSVIKKGSTVPVKVKVYDAGNLSVSTPGTITSFAPVASAANTAAVVNEVLESTTPDTAFRWDSTGQQWIFNLSTKSYVIGTKYYFRITFADGTSVSFAFTTK